MKRYCFAVDLYDDPELIREYEQWHQTGNIPPAIPESIRTAGIIQMEIYRTGNRLFMIMETTDDYDPAQKAILDANNPAVQQWEQFMWKFQRPLPWAGAGEKWVQAKCIFRLDQ